jgi:TatD DNase family protein
MIDFHCHLDLYPNPQRVVEECITRKIYILSVTTTPSAFHGTMALASGSKRVRTALGLHPQLAQERKHELDLFIKLLPTIRYVGEIGLDGSPELKKTWDDQVFVFRYILDHCQRLGGRILSMHSRRATLAVLDILEEYPNVGIPVLHWFSGSLPQLTRASNLGCWFSVGPAMLSSDKGRQLVQQIPRDRILTETDGPFVQLKGRPAYPWDIEIVTKQLAKLWNIPNDAAESLIQHNFTNLISKLI